MSKGKIRVDEGGGVGGVDKEVDFPSNSHKAKKEPEDNEKKVKKITKGTVVTKKKSLSKRMMSMLVGDDVSSVSSYIIYDVIIPSAKSTISDIVSGGIEMLLFGDTRGSRTTRNRDKSYVSYNNYYNKDHRGAGGSGRLPASRDISTRSRSSHNFDDIILGARGEAEEVLSHLVDLTEDYGMATVADLYDLVGITANFTDNKYGWDSLGSASVSRVREGYLINLPKTRLLD